MIALSANATHLFQPLDVAVFKPFKPIVRQHLDERMFETADPTISKKEAIKIVCSAYRGAIIEHPSNAVEGFRGTGLHPLSLVQLHRRLGVYQAGGVKGDHGNATWLVRQQVLTEFARKEILPLPPESLRTPKKRRTTIDIAGKLVTREMLEEASV